MNLNRNLFRFVVLGYIPSNSRFVFFFFDKWRSNQQKIIEKEREREKERGAVWKSQRLASVRNGE